MVGYAAAAAALGWVLSTDLTGHLWLRCALHAGAAAVLGAIAWRISERMTDWVNLHTSPVLRLGVSGVVGALLATWGTGAFCELGVGMGALWPEALCALLFLGAALPPTIAGVTLIAGLETMLAARRGGGGAVQALQPIWRYLATGLVLAIATAYVAVELPGHIERVLVGLAPQGLRTSGWVEREKRLFRAVQEGSSCEVLVVPFAAGTTSVDRTARSLMTRYLAAELAARSGQCVADPTLVMRALGSRARTPVPEEVRALGEAMNVHWVVSGRVTRDTLLPRMSIAIRVDQRNGPQNWSEGGESNWGPIEFSDALPPEAAFARVSHEMAEGLGLQLQPSAEPEPAPSGLPLPSNPTALASATESPVARARGLQLLAALHATGDVDGEQLWERSLIALRALPVADETARMLRGRAYLHLYRRPFALAQLQGLASAEAQALLALAQGNLTLVEPLAREVRDPAGFLTLQMEIERLRARYGKSAGIDQRRRVLLDSYPGYAALIDAMLSQDDADAALALALIRKQLAADGLEPPQASLQALAERAGIHFAAGGLGVAGAIASSYEAAWRERAALWRGQAAYDRVAQWDAVDALYGAARAAVTQAARAQAADPKALIAMVRSLGIGYAGYPPLVGVLAGALQATSGSGQAALQQARAQRLPNEVLAWEGGESDTERELRARVPELPNPEPDEPPRPWRTVAADADGRAAELVRLQAYSWDTFAPLEQAIVALGETGQAATAQRLAEEAGVRFIGSPERERFLLRRAEETGDLATHASVLLEHVREQPRDWPAYVQLARVYLSARQPVNAQQVLLAFPAREDESASAAASERAQQAGMLLFDYGAAELARPLLERAAVAAESAAGLWSRLALAQLDGNWAEVRARAAELHEKYQSAGALRRVATVAFLLGDNEGGWRAFYESAKRFEDFDPWSAALVGHRIEHTRGVDVIAFAEHWKSLSGDRRREVRLKGYFLLNALLIDRAASGPLLQDLAKLGDKWEDPEFAALVTGYSAFTRGDFAEAASRLLPLYKPGVQPAVVEVLPYLAVALSRADQAAEAQALVAAARRQAPLGFHALAASAYLAGAAGRTDQALQLLWQAFVVLPARADNLVPAGFQLLELCEQLYALTRDDRYRALLVDLARRQRNAWPVSWAYAFEARYVARGDEAEAALGVAQFLDPESAHLHDFSDDQRKRAAARYSGGNPFQRG